MSGPQVDYGVDHLTVRYGPVVALNDVTFQIPSGRVVAVVGGDGAGKSTLLRTLVGLQAPSSGIVRAPGDEEIGFLPASAGSWSALTVQQNMEFVAEIFGDADSGRSQSLLEQAGLWFVRDRLATDLSGGMRKKLGFCMAVLSDPRLIVLDEPSTGVDPVSRVDLWRMISTAAAAGASIIMATTYLDEAERASDVLALDRGEILLHGPPAELMTDMPGVVVDTMKPGNRELAWRRGRRYREWIPDGVVEDGRSVPPDLETTVIVASLAKSLRLEVSA